MPLEKTLHFEQNMASASGLIHSVLISLCVILDVLLTQRVNFLDE